MALKVRFTPRAAQDLKEIRAYLIERSPVGADRVRRDIDRTIGTLADYPGIGHASDIAGVCVPPTARYPYLVYHALRRGELIILHVRHAARRPAGPEEVS